jgi:hypothetical protein
VRQAILAARSELEAEAARATGLRYIGSRAIRTRLQASHLSDVPSRATIERVLHSAGVTRPKAPTPQVVYPRLQATQPHQLVQVDHMPHFLTGGQRVFCFNAIDVVSRYPLGQVYPQRRAADAVDFLIRLAQTLGVPTYTQLDNEACFSGGFTHPYVLGQCVRLALQVGTELVFTPHYHPQSNGTVERFHQEYQRHVWQDTYLADCQTVQQQAEQFFALYRQSTHHAALAGQSPQTLHQRTPPARLPVTLPPPQRKRPLYAGRIHFMRRVQAAGTVSVLNVAWALPPVDPLQGVWVTIELAPSAATLAIYSDSPQVAARTCLAAYPFPLSEPVLARPTSLQPVVEVAPPAVQTAFNDARGVTTGPAQVGRRVPVMARVLNAAKRHILPASRRTDDLA